MSSSGANGFLWRGGPESLIREVFAREPIWDLRSHAHHNRELVARLWEEISDILKAPTDTIKTKWKHLRDNFRTELKKTVRGSGDPIKPYQSQWTYFNDLLFLKEQMMRKITHNTIATETYTYNDTATGTYNDSATGTYNDTATGTYNDTVTGTYNDNDITSEDGFVSLAVESEMITEEGRLVERQPNFFGHSLFDDNNSDVFENVATNSLSQPTRKRRHCEPPEQPFKVHVSERIPYTNFDDTSNDDDYHFLMSLLPYVKSLTLAKKMHLRLKLQEAVCEFIYNIKIPRDSDRKQEGRGRKSESSTSNRGAKAKVEKTDK